MTSRSFVLVVFLVASFAFSRSESFAQKPGDLIPNRYIIGVRPGFPAVAVFLNHGLEPDHVYAGPLNGFSSPVPPELIKYLVKDPNILSIVPDRVIGVIEPPDALGRPGADGKNGGGKTSQSQVIPSGVQRIGAYGLGVTGAGVGIAIVDTGLDFDHADLTVSPDHYFPESGAKDDNGHGTHVGGTAAAKDNTIDVVGVAPGATLYAVKVLGSSGRGRDSDIIAGLTWVYQNALAVDPPIRVVNMSLGRPGRLDDSPLLRDIVRDLAAVGISVVVAAGNDPDIQVWQEVPALYPWAMAVASTTATPGTNQTRLGGLTIGADTASYFTTDGAYHETPDGWMGVTISAPGEDRENINKAGFLVSSGILSTRLGGGTTRMSGTSMASPHVAGVVALLWEAWEMNAAVPLDPEQARSIIRSTADASLTVPYDSPVSAYTFDGEREGVVSAPDAVLQALAP